jgi:hypothetical protein
MLKRIFGSLFSSNSDYMTKFVKTESKRKLRDHLLANGILADLSPEDCVTYDMEIANHLILIGENSARIKTLIKLAIKRDMIPVIITYSIDKPNEYMAKYLDKPGTFIYENINGKVKTKLF